ncbi:hypothetical protein P170DRAFT_129179 [Aspergillus steynii IBT 23096]|uniref:Uncharacterized protein n=1 Tax=Aspergillus steynii IBT 23096 TaxID=1392250 RepID=A0A2I2GKI0_9EURO|nr:uncharacterized protein P170DRAFT_129179 [Aspergillus steynii IBT 23096]PLB53388.1 hypothetical protein P170DRAFT_129179 [Aspergillus steynii IBT 23096]
MTVAPVQDSRKRAVLLMPERRSSPLGLGVTLFSEFFLSLFSILDLLNHSHWLGPWETGTIYLISKLTVFSKFPAWAPGSVIHLPDSSRQSTFPVIYHGGNGPRFDTNLPLLSIWSFLYPLTQVLIVISTI